MIQPSLKQQQALTFLGDWETVFLGYGGAAYGGKSWLGCSWVVSTCLAFNGVRYGIARKELVTLKKTTLNTLFKVFGDSQLKLNVHYKINWQTHVIKFANGSEIVLIDTAYKPTDPLYLRLGGYELTGVFIDESNESPSESINILSTRIGRCLNYHYGIPAKVLETFNPSKNHVYNRYYSPHKNGLLKKEFKFIKALPTDNPSPEGKAYVKRILDTSDTTTIERLIHGNFDYDDDPNQLIDYEATLNMFTNNHLLKVDLNNKPIGKKYITGDIAFFGSDLFVVYVWCDWCIIDCVVMEKSNGKQIEETIKNLSAKHGIPQSQIVYDADGAGNYLKGYLANARSFNNGGKPIDEVGQKVEYENLKAQCYFKLAAKINANEIFINDFVATLKIKDKFVREHITDEIPAIKKDNNVTNKLKLISKKLMKELIGHSPDFLDALMMRLLFELKPASFKAPKIHI